MDKKSRKVDLLSGSIVKGMISFCIPIFIGQLLQQLYNAADAWVLGNYADNYSFAAVSSGGNISFFIIGFLTGLGAGGGIVVSRYYGEKDRKALDTAIHSDILFGLICSVLATVLGLVLIPQLLRIMNTPAEVMPYSLLYFRIIFGGITASVMYNCCMSVMQAIGDSFHPLLYLIFSSILNVVLDFVLVAHFNMGVAGAAIATVFSQGVSAVLCLIHMSCFYKEFRLVPAHIFRWNGKVLGQILEQGLPMGVQNSVISIGNMVVQTNINSFGPNAMSGMGAYSKVEGFVFIPIMGISMAIPTFISQNLGAKQYDRAKKGALLGVVVGVILSELVGVLFIMFDRLILRFFIDEESVIQYGLMHVHVVALFYCLLAYSHLTAGIMRGCGKAIVPMITMLSIWCVIRIIYVTIAIQIIPKFTTISWCYPLTWTLSSIVFTIWLLKNDWTHNANISKEYSK